MTDPINVGAVAAAAASNVSGAPYGKSDATFAAWLDKAYPNETIPATSKMPKLAGSTLGAQYKTFAAQYEGEIKTQYPTTYLAETQGAFMVLVGEATLAKGAASAAGETAKSTAQVAQGTGAGINQFASSLNDALTLSGISGTNLAIRVAKVAIGGILVIVGLASFTGLIDKAPAAVKTAVKAAPFL